MKTIHLTKRYCVYVDDTLEDIPRHFYVGKGTEDRVNLIERNELHAWTHVKVEYQGNVI